MAEDRHESSGCRRWLKPVLVLSLAVNLLVIGAAIGLALYWPRHDFAEGSRIFGISGLAVLSGALDDRHKRSIGVEIRGRKGGLRELRELAGGNAARLIEVLRAEPFAPLELEEHFRQQRDHAMNMLADGHELLAPRIIAMTPEERNRFADRIEAGLGKRGRRHH